MTNNPFDFEIDYAPKKPYTQYKLMSIQNKVPEDVRGMDNIYWDTFYECYVKYISESESYFYFRDKWCKEGMPNIIHNRVQKNQGMIKIESNS